MIDVEGDETKEKVTLEQKKPSDDSRLNASLQSNTGKPCECGGKGEEGCSCNPSMKKMTSTIPSYVYAIGKIEARFPSRTIMQEYRQAGGRIETTGQTDQEVMRTVLSQRANRYLARKMCWVFTIERVDTYILTPQDPTDLDALTESLRTLPRPTDIDVVIGIRGPISTPEMCNGLMVPIVIFDQIYTFDRDTLIKSIPKPENIAEKQFRSTAEEVFDRTIQIADNIGANNEHRVLNYLAVRYETIYANTVEMHRRDFSLSSIETRPSRLSQSGTQKIIDVIFSYTNRKTGVAEKYYCRVAADEFPYLVSPLSPYYER